MNNTPQSGFESGRFSVDVKVEFKKADGTVIGRRHAEILDLSYGALVEVQGILKGVEDGLQRAGEARAGGKGR